MYILHLALKSNVSDSIHSFSTKLGNLCCHNICLIYSDSFRLLTTCNGSESGKGLPAVINFPLCFEVFSFSFSGCYCFGILLACVSWPHLTDSVGKAVYIRCNSPLNVVVPWWTSRLAPKWNMPIRVGLGLNICLLCDQIRLFYPVFLKRWHGPNAYRKLTQVYRSPWALALRK